MAVSLCLMHTRLFIYYGGASDDVISFSRSTNFRINAAVDELACLHDYVDESIKVQHVPLDDVY